MAGTEAGGLPEVTLDPVIHPLPRLRICALLDPVTEEEFGTLRDLLGVSDSALSKQLAALSDAEYTGQRRAIRGGRSRVWVRLTPDGRRAFRAHVAALTELAAIHSSGSAQRTNKE